MFVVIIGGKEDEVSHASFQSAKNKTAKAIVFLDDNPFERNLIRGLIPDITVPELPEDPACYLSYLKERNLFETASFSVADFDRTKQYREEIGRQTLQKQFATYDDYLQGLQMIAEAKPFDRFHFSRIAQLTQRSNQFNLRTIRYTESEVERITADSRYITLYYTLRDKFGDQGLISVVIMKKQDDGAAFVDSWLMSCRVLKRGMEEFIINKMIEAARSAGCIKIIGEYLKTPKNSMVEDIYQRMGFTPLGEDKYEVNLESFIPRKTFISE